MFENDRGLLQDLSYNILCWGNITHFLLAGVVEWHRASEDRGYMYIGGPGFASKSGTEISQVETSKEKNTITKQM